MNLVVNLHADGGFWLVKGAGKRQQTQNKPITPRSAPPPAKSNQQKELGPENKD